MADGVRLATTDADLRSVAILAGRWAGDLGAPMDPAYPARFLREWPATRGVAWLCSDGGRDIGFAAVVEAGSLPWLDTAQRVWWHLSGLYIHPAHRHKSQGMSLLKAVREEAQRRGIARVTVTADDDVRDVYARAGFVGQPKAMAWRP